MGIVLDEEGNVVSGGRPGQRKAGRPRKQQKPVSTAALTKLGKRLVGLSIGDAMAVVAEWDPPVKVDFQDAGVPFPTVFRSNHLRAAVEGGVVVDAEPG